MNQASVKGFDLKTHPRHPKTGQIMAENLYSLVVKQSSQGSGSEWLYERPVRSGIFYYPNGELAKEASSEGLARIALAEKEASKSALEKARAKHAQAAAEVKAAEVAHEAELKARNASESKGR